MTSCAYWNRREKQEDWDKIAMVQLEPRIVTNSSTFDCGLRVRNAPNMTWCRVLVGRLSWDSCFLSRLPQELKQENIILPHLKVPCSALDRSWFSQIQNFTCLFLCEPDSRLPAALMLPVLATLTHHELSNTHWISLKPRIFSEELLQPIHPEVNRW